MAEISLRAYLQEVDDLVEHEHLDEAIAHCRHLLQTYPKHVETYRLLGKCYLEAKRFGDAADLFQRVLSAIPDDFVAHIGMSIVREDEGNLDAAIWHMERAFETNPANPAIQQELRRLIGRRDGLEPHKVRLTRGALARMYAHGELYPQAIAELRSALQEDPDRPDLQTLLAEMYWRTDQRSEAGEVCNRLLARLPFCRDGLRILAAVLHAGGSVDEAAVYHRRLASLDPYAAFLETAVADPKTVEPGAVRVEHLDWRPGQPVPTADVVRPQWTPGLGAAEEKRAPPPSVPSWVSALEMPSASPEAPSPREAEEPAVAASEETPLAADIPEWMRQAGWSESTGQAVETPVSFSEEELASLDSGNVAPPPVSEADLQPADLPEWLKKIAPAEGPAYSEPRTQPAAARDLPDWLGEFSVAEGSERPPESAAESGPTAEPEPVSPALPLSPGGGETIPTWLEAPADGATETIIGWLGRREPPAEAEQPAAEGPSMGQDVPSSSEPSAAQEEEVPSWVTRMPATGAPPPPEEEEAGGLPSWLSGVAEAASQEDRFSPADLEAIRPGVSMPVPKERDLGEEPSKPVARADAPDWLRAIVGGEPSPAMAKQSVTPPHGMPRPPSQIEPSTAPPTPAAQEPELSWMGGLGGTEAAEPAPATSDEGEPEWMRGLGESESKPQPAGMDWLRGLSEAAAAAPPADGGAAREPEPSEPTPASPWQPGPTPEPPDWMKGVTPVEPRPEEAAPTRPEPPATAEPSAAAAPTPPSVSSHAPPDWLREFAEEPQAPEETLTPAEIPSWLREFGDRGSAEAGAPAAPRSPEEAPSPEFEGALDWLQESASQVSPDPVPTQVAPTAPPPQMGVSEPVPDDEVFRWLENLATRQGEEPPPTFAPSEPAAVTPPMTVPPPGAVPESVDEGIEWLEKLAEEHAAPAPQPSAAPVEPAPEAETEWLSEIAARPSAEASPELWDQVEAAQTEPAAATPAAEARPTSEAPPTVRPARPTPDETLPGVRRPAAAPTPEPSIEPETSRTSPLTESEVVEWLAQTASAARAMHPETPPPPTTPGAPQAEAAEAIQPTAPPPPPEEEPTVVAEEADPAAALAAQLIEAARAAMDSGDFAAALQAYAPVIDRGLRLETVIEDLRRAAEARPDATALWQSLGDAYKKANRLAEAHKAYSKSRKEEDGLESARDALAAGDFARAVAHYGGLIKKKRNLDVVIEDLRGALDQDPRRPTLWQALGDAYMKTNRLPEAIEAYRRGMESV